MGAEPLAETLTFRTIRMDLIGKSTETDMSLKVKKQESLLYIFSETRPIGNYGGPQS